MALRKSWVVGFGLIGASLAALTIGACSGDDTNGGGSPDASADHTTTPDSSGADTSTDTSTDTSADSSPDVHDAGPTCVGNGDAALDDAAVAAGMALVLQLKCANCHQATPADAGLTLEGKTTSLVDGGSVYPANLTPDKVTGIGCYTDTQLVEAILHAKDPADGGRRLCIMPAWATRVGLDGGSAEQIVQFLRSLPPVSHAIPDTTMCPSPPDGGTSDGGDAAIQDAADGG